MEHIGTYEVPETNIPNIAIINHDNLITMSTGRANSKKHTLDTTIMRLKEFRKNKRLNGLNLKSMLQEGRD